MTMHNDQICFVFRKLAIEAGSVIMDIYNQNNFEIKIKNDDSPVTIADEAADKIIYEGLQKLFQIYQSLQKNRQIHTLKKQIHFL